MTYEWVSIINVLNDPKGRIIIADISIDDVVYTLVNIYGPNIDSPSFFHNISTYLTNFDCGILIWGGDFNLVFNSNLDKIGRLPRTNFNARSEVLNICHKFNLVDVWRERNPLYKKFSWNSSIDFIQCRLDFFLVSRHLLQHTSAVQMLILYRFFNRITHDKRYFLYAQ